MVKKYAPLADYLENLDRSSATLSFSQLEKILQFSLPASAKKYQAWWSNSLIDGRHSEAWLTKGWNTFNLDLSRQLVTFRCVRTERSIQPKRIKTHTVQRTSKFDPATLSAPDLSAECIVSVKLNWRRLGMVSISYDGKLVFPSAPTVAGIYRLIVHSSNGITVYVGEAVNLHRRFGNYRRPGKSQQTNLRLNAILCGTLSHDGLVSVDIAFENIELRVSGKSTAADLTNKAIRRLVEQAALVAYDGIDVGMLNH